MARRAFVTVAIAAVLAAAIGSAQAAPVGGARQRPPIPLADSDADGLSDGLEAALATAAPDDRLDVIATFARASDAAAARAALGIPATPLGLVDGFATTVTAAQVRALARAPGLFRVEETPRFTTTMDGAQADFGTARARTDYGVTGSGVGVCVADTGADQNHEQLDGSKIVAFADFIEPSNTTPIDPHGHGTHVASILAGDGTGSGAAARFQGVAPGASLSIARVLDASGYSTATSVFNGLEWCANQPAVKVISMSLGSLEPSDGNDALSRAVNDAVTDMGKIVVVAAGNAGDDREKISSPGAAAQAITVGAVAEHSVPVDAFWHSNGIYLTSFSSRGPTLGGLMKPDVVAPGHTILAAQAGTAATYIGYSGTSMATPFVAGTVALGLARDPSLSAATAKSLLEQTAADRGPSGKDGDWGAGLLDGYAFVARAGGATEYTPTAFPTRTLLNASVANGGVWRYDFTLTEADLETPIAATIVIDGERACTLGQEPWCFSYEWRPDLDARLLDPSNREISLSQCVLGDECGIGRQETLRAMPTVAGTYRIEVFPFSGEPNNGLGGSFTVELSRGPVAGGGTPPPPPPPPPPTYHVGDLDATKAAAKRGWKATVSILVHTAAHVKGSGVVVEGSWNGGPTVTCTTNAKGRCSLTLSNISNSVASVTFTVASLNGEAASGGHDPDSDSDGSSITVTRP